MKNGGTQNSVAVASLGAPKLPDFAITVSGVQFNPRADVWDFYDGLDWVYIDFCFLRRNVSDDFVQNIKVILVHAAQEVSPLYLVKCHKSVEKFIESLSIGTILERIDLAGVRHFWNDANVLEDYKFLFRGVIERWTKNRFTGIDEAVLEFLRRQKVTRRIVGESVLTWDPISGPLTDNEFKGYYESLIDAYAEARLKEHEFLITWLVTALGIRPRQVALLKVCDVLRKTDNGTESFSISIPRIKQRGQIPRDEMYEWPVIDEIGSLLYKHGRNQEKMFDGLVNDIDQSPLFTDEVYCDVGIPQPIFPTANKGRGEESRESKNSGANLSLHMAVSSVIDVLRNVFDSLDFSSERVGNRIVLNARRLRKTYGTRLAADNVPAPVLAAMLGHRDIRSSKPYIAATSRLQDRLDKSLAFELAPLAQAFRGEFLTEADNRSNGAVIRDLRLVPSGEQLGKCDKTGYCGYAAPVACYTCKKFRPWKDAPHELIFDFLWERRRKRSADFEKDVHMTMLHDRTILAVAQVILQCNEKADS
ncbi:site-specific integrase [Massilia sp. YIM B02443]|uniref:site-specific integrase n=1 Tax=Massilia sp. YIM B02443 TaxID=3050127 RepID=UPI0025B6E97E|nr:site-specific integrase [Massilia sp. YIM B02443]MDN4035881.1 site-specific integrase [Massilia sp. YIM B02443]